MEKCMEFPLEDLEITALAYGGDAVARRKSGKVCFLPGVLPGEKVRVTIREEKKNYSYGTALEILEKSPRRILPECTLECPSCPYRMMDYPFELEWKERQLREFAARLKKMEVETILPPVGAAERTQWRNKVSFHLSKGELCYVARDNVTLLPVKDCLLAKKEIREFLREGSFRSRLERGAETVTFRVTEKDGVSFFTDKTRREKVLTETLGPFGEFRVGMRSFFQINPVMARRLAEEFLLFAEETIPKEILELYCGCGPFSILAAEKYHIPCSGIELDPSAIAHAKENASLHGVEKYCSFHAGDAGEAMKIFRRGKSCEAGTLLVADPPRTGLAPNVRSMVLDSGAENILYISCGPASLMRDLDFLAEKYRAEKMLLLDLFPSTAHWESLTLLRRR